MNITYLGISDRNCNKDCGSRAAQIIATTEEGDLLTALLIKEGYEVDVFGNDTESEIYVTVEDRNDFDNLKEWYKVAKKKVTQIIKESRKKAALKKAFITYSDVDWDYYVKGHLEDGKVFEAHWYLDAHPWFLRLDERLKINGKAWKLLVERAVPDRFEVCGKKASPKGYRFEYVAKEGQKDCENL